MAPLADSTHLRAGLFLLAALVSVDVAFVAADILHRQQIVEDSRFLVTRDRGFGEMVQYAKGTIAAFLLGVVAIARHSRAAAVWAVLLAVAVADDALLWHERAAVPIAEALRLPDYRALRANHIGELLFFGAIGLPALVLLGAAWVRGTAFDRRLTASLFVGAGALGVCAVLMDALSALTRHSPAGPAFAVVEDGGEMIALSVVLFTIWAVALAPRRAPTPASFGAAGSRRFRTPAP